MPVVSPPRPTFNRWRYADSVYPPAEKDGLAWALQHREEEEAAFDFEDGEAPPVEDDGMDRHDLASELGVALASPSIGERDPNAAIHDQYLGTVFAR